MLNHLSIKGLAIIEELNIDFTQGFCVITGETGAGKSILIKALNLLFGAKSSSSHVRKGFDKATVSGHFYLPLAHEAVTLIQSLDIEGESEDGKMSVIIRRNLSSKGRSQAWINDVPVTMASLKNVAGTLVDIFGQHENTRLLDGSTHTYYLDQFIKNKTILSDIEKVHKESMSSLGRLREMIAAYRNGQRSVDYLSFRVNELESFDPSKADYEELKTICKESGQKLEVKETILQAQSALDEAIDGESASKPLWDVHYLFNKLSDFDQKFKDFSKRSSLLATQIDDLSFDLGKVLGDIGFDEEDLEAKQDRLATYQELFRKMLVSGIDELIEEKQKLQEELAFLDQASIKAADELAHLKSQALCLEKLSRKLTRARMTAAKQVKKRVEQEFSDLAMPGAVFDVSLEPSIHIVPDLDISIFGEKLEKDWADVCDLLSEQGSLGTEKANFMLSANPGEPAMPINKIASGGEVSRIMLALKKALLAGANTCILVFDEIDTGISGRVASMVGKKMKELSKDFQIICISHLPQVAAYADSHYLVHKYRNNKRTESTIDKLNKNDSLKEIAKLLSGDKVSKSSLANAKTLVKKACDSVGL